MFCLSYTSSGEESLASYLKGADQRYHAGADVRLIQIPADAGKGFGVFDHIFELKDGAELTKLKRTNSRQFYGTAAPAFIDKLIRDRDTVVTKLERYIDDFQESISSLTLGSQATRVSEQLAVISSAGELATEYGITGWDAGDAMNSLTTPCLATGHMTAKE